MFTDNLYDIVLLDPVLSNRADYLKIVSGYSSPAMLSQHVDDLIEQSDGLSGIELIIGMTKGNVFEGDQNLFKDWMDNGYNGVRVTCGYIYSGIPVHSKVYVWEKDNTPIEAYLGSANYSQNAFTRCSSREAVETCNPTDALAYYNSLDTDSIFSNHPDLEDHITISKVRRTDMGRTNTVTQVPEPAVFPTTAADLPTTYTTLSFLDRQGRLPTTSGLNWGHRDNRNRNEAYIRIPRHISGSGFFPNRKQHFTVLTDDGKSMICVTAQPKIAGAELDVYSAIETPTNNSILGEYFRRRLGLASGALVADTDLIRYGRTDVSFYKIDEDTYYMDFSVRTTP